MAGLELAVYMRLSKKGLLDGESSSIDNQRKIIYDYIASQNIEYPKVEEYVDDGYTGANFNRPGVQKMLKGIQAKKIGCVIIKDLSRFGRNFQETQEHLHDFFLKPKVRLISIGDRLDTADMEQLPFEVSFKNLLHYYYVSSLSQKVRSALKSMVENGSFIPRHPAFGYKIVNEFGHRAMKADERSSKIVKDIFKLAIQGCSMKEIAHRLNASNMPTPLQYQKSKGKYKSFKDNFWRIGNNFYYTKQ